MQPFLSTGKQALEKLTQWRATNMQKTKAVSNLWLWPLKRLTGWYPDRFAICSKWWGSKKSSNLRIKSRSLFSTYRCIMRKYMICWIQQLNKNWGRTFNRYQACSSKWILTLTNRTLKIYLSLSAQMQKSVWGTFGRDLKTKSCRLTLWIMPPQEATAF